MESKWLENHEMINFINENLCNLKKCIAVPDHSFQKKDETMQSKDSKFSHLDKHIVVVKNYEGNFSEDSWATVVKNKVSSKLKSVPVHKTVLNKKGQGCIFLFSEKEKYEAIEVLKSDFKVTPSNPV